MHKNLALKIFLLATVISLTIGVQAFAEGYYFDDNCACTIDMDANGTANKFYYYYPNAGEAKAACTASGRNCPNHHNLPSIPSFCGWKDFRYYDGSFFWYHFSFNDAYPGCVVSYAPEEIAMGENPQEGQRSVEPIICALDRVGNPISIYSGNNFEQAQDVRLASAGIRPLLFKRFYNSRSALVGPSGFGWSHSYHLSLNPSYQYNNKSYLKIIDESGRTIYFNDQGNGIFSGTFGESTLVELEAGNYIWRRTDQSRFAFAADGKLLWIEDAAGNRVDLAYGVDESLNTVTDTTGGRSITLHYNAQGYIDHIIGPVTEAVSNGTWVSYGYDGSGNLTSVLYADGSGLDYEYTDPIDAHNVTAKKDKAGHIITTWSYDDQDRAVDSFSRNGIGAAINYVDETSVEVTDAYGITRTYGLETKSGYPIVGSIEGPEGCTTCSSDIKRLKNNSNRNIIEAEYANGLINQYDNYDSRGNPQTVRMTVGTPDEKTVTYAFHPNLNVKLIKTENSVIGVGSKVTIWDYDDDGNAIANENPTVLVHRIVEQGYTKDASGAVVPYEYITAYIYNSKGQVLSIDGPKPGTQDLTSFIYDPATGDLISVTQPIVGTTTYSEYDAAGQVGRVTDANGNAVSFTYDGRGRIVTMTNETDSSTTTFEYYNSGDIKRIIQPNGVTVDYTYDSTYGRLTRITDTLGNYIEYGYDTQGNRTQKSFYNPSGERQFWMRYDYQGPGSPGKLWKEIFPDNAYTQYSYTASGDIDSVTDSAGKVTSYDYDILKRLSTVTQPGDVITAYAYDSQDNLLSVTDPENLATTYTYDDMQRVVSVSSPDTGNTGYVYDAAGNMLSKTDANGITATYIYDDLNRLTSIQYPDSSQNIVYTYDEGTNGNGRLTGMTDASGSYQYTYDEQGRLLNAEKSIEGVPYTTTYTYDAAGLLTGITYPGGRIVTYEINAAGKVTRVTTSLESSTRTLAENIDYLPFGPMKNLIYGNGTALSAQFDQRYRLTHLTTGTLQQLEYGFDAVGNITSITNHLDPGRSRSFGYDDLYRITGSAGVYGSIGYTYDNVGNRLTKDENGQVDTYSYAAGSHRLSQITGANPLDFAYDAAGNITGQGVKTYGYNQNNRLVSVTEASTVTGEYIYNGNGQRIKKTVGSGSSIFHYDQYGNLIGESGPDGQFSVQYVYLGNTRLAALTGETVTEVTVQVTTSLGNNLSGINVYAFIEAGAYTGMSAVTDTEGIARFAISDFADGSYTFRADYLSYQFWSGVIDIPAVSQVNIQIAEETATIEVTQGGTPKTDVRVYLFNENGSYLGLYEITDENGRVFFDLPADQSYKFRADVLGSQFFSETVTVVSDAENSFAVVTNGGTLTFALQKEAGQVMEGVRVYLFKDSGSYLGLYNTTDGAGEAEFAVPSGSYKVRIDYLGYQFWTDAVTVSSDAALSLTIPHQDVTVTAAGDNGSDIEPREGLKVYLFTSAGPYQGQYRITDAQGQAVFNLPDRDYKVRTDYLSQQFWSQVFNQADQTVTIPECRAEVIVTRMNNSLSNVPVYVFNGAGSYLNLNDTTDAGGQALFRLPSGEYNFRADYLGSQYFSGNTTLITHQANPVEVSTGGGNFTLAVQKALEEPMPGVKCYLFSATGTYLGHQTTTSDQGEAPFDLADGDYKIRIDYLGYQFWTPQFTIPDTEAMTETIAHQDITVTIAGDFNGDIQPVDGIKAYLFKAAGVYQGLYQITDSQGQVIFSLPQQDYKVRADYLSQQFWSDDFSQVDQTVTINEGVARIEVSQGSSPLENVTVYVFNSSGTYLGQNSKTDSGGHVEFRLPEGTYKFRVDHQGSRYWATEPVTAHQINDIALSTGGGTFVLTVEKGPGRPIVDVPVYVFSQSGSYLGVNARSDVQGQVTFDLADGGYMFRVDYMGYQFWSSICTVPEILSDVLTIAHRDVTVTAGEVYNANSDPLENVRVYLFTAAGTYQGLHSDTNGQGQVEFNLPEQDYKVRVDYLGAQHWSEVFNAMDVDVDIAHGIADIHVINNGEDVEDAPVYLFTEAGSYLNRMERTDAGGRAEFFIPEGSYKFRVDHDGIQHWSDVINIIAHEEIELTLALDLLALDLTRDPNPVRFDGIPPVKETEPVLLASLFDITGILARSAVGSIGGETVNYFINDHLGTSLMVVDEGGQVLWNADYLPFGESSVTTSTIENKFRFPGQYYDQETGLHYNHFRYYDPSTGRYLTPDPIGLLGGINLWTYTSNNPTNRIDPDGLEPMFGSGGCEISGGYDSKEAFEEFLLENYGLNLGELKLQGIQLNLLLTSIVFESPTSIMKGAVAKKLSIRWEQNSQRWRDVATGRYTKGPRLPKGFGKPSTWKEGMKDVSNEMIATKEGQKIYEMMRNSSVQEDFIGALEHVLKNMKK